MICSTADESGCTLHYLFRFAEMLSKVTGAQECDARDDDQGTAAGNIKNKTANI